MVAYRPTQAIVNASSANAVQPGERDLLVDLAVDQIALGRHFG